MWGDFSLKILRNWLGGVMCETQLVRRCKVNVLHIAYP